MLAVRLHVMRTRWTEPLAVALVSIVLSGCGTVSTRMTGNAGPYQGFGYDMEKMSNADEWVDFSGQGSAGGVPFVWPPGLLWFVDAPLSLVADTLLVPVDALRSKGAKEEVKPGAGPPGGAANGSQRMQSETNGTSPAAGSRR